MTLGIINLADSCLQEVIVYAEEMKGWVYQRASHTCLVRRVRVYKVKVGSHALPASVPISQC